MYFLSISKSKANKSPGALSWICRSGKLGQMHSRTLRLSPPRICDRKAAVLQTDPQRWSGSAHRWTQSHRSRIPWIEHLTGRGTTCCVFRVGVILNGIDLHWKRHPWLYQVQLADSTPSVAIVKMRHLLPLSLLTMTLSFYWLKKLLNVLNVSAIKDIEIVIMLKFRDWSHFKMNYLYNLDMIAFGNHSIGI